MSLLVEGGIIFGRMFSLFARWDTGRNALLDQFIAKPVSIIASIRQQFCGLGQALKQMPGSLVITGLSFGEKEQQGSPQAVGYGMQLGVQAASGLSDTAGKSPLFSRLAAVRWALRWVASIISLSG